MPRIIFDAVAKAHLLQHFEIVFGAHAQPLRFEQLGLRFKIDNAMFELVANGTERAIEFVGRGDELFRWIKRDDAERFMGVAGEGIEARDGVEFVAEKFEPDRFLIGGGRINFDHVAAHAELAAREIHVVALV